MHQLTEEKSLDKIHMSGEVRPKKADGIEPCLVAGFFYGEKDDGIAGKGMVAGNENTAHEDGGNVACNGEVARFSGGMVRGRLRIQGCGEKDVRDRFADPGSQDGNGIGPVGKSR